MGADEGFELRELVLGGFAGCGFDFAQEAAHVGGGAHHLVDGGEVGPTAEAEELGHLLAEAEEVVEDLLVGGVSRGRCRRGTCGGAGRRWRRRP